MKTGDTVRDGQGQSYQVGQLLGRGLWGKSYLVRREADDATLVLKCSLAAGDLKGDVPDLVWAISREAVLEQARLYEQGQFPFLPRLEGRVNVAEGQPGYLVPRFAETLERRIHEGIPVGALVDTLLAVARHLRQLGSNPGFHGGLRPSNVLFDEKGEVFLTDVATAATRRALPRLAAVGAGQPWLPPEIVEAQGEPAWSPVADTWGVAMMLWRGVVATDMPPPFPRNGLDKASQVALKDRLIDRMKLEDSNPRFHARMAERVAVLLSRALSRETSPSPPYRFPRVDELHARMEEVAALIRPQVNSVGKVMLDRPASKPWFTTDEDVVFSCTVGTTAGVEGHEEIGVGIAVFEIDRDLRLKELDLGYTVDKHPSGRYRFGFRIGGLAPGHYRARIAFAIRDSGHPPATAESEYMVRAAPGWVPRAEPAMPAPLAMRPETDTVTQGIAQRNPAMLPPSGMAEPTFSFDESPDTAVPVDPEPPPAPVYAETAVLPRPMPRPAAVVEEAPPEPEEHHAEPTWNRRDWSHEPLPSAETARDLESEGEDPTVPADDDAGEPGLVAKITDQLRNDPYIAVMAGLGVIIAGLLIVFLVLRN